MQIVVAFFFLKFRFWLLFYRTDHFGVQTLTERTNQRNDVPNTRNRQKRCRYECESIDAGEREKKSGKSGAAGRQT